MRLATKRSGVSALIGTLLMVAMAVTLSVALFVSTTGYLSGLTSSIGNSQPGQNRATQTIVTIENTVSKAYTTGFATNPTNGYVELFVRSVGSVGLTIGSVSAVAPPTNAGQTKSFAAVLNGLTWAIPYSNVYLCSEGTSDTACEVGAGACTSTASTVNTLTSQANTAKVWIEWCPGAAPAPKSGDAFQIQVSTTVGASNIITINIP